MNWLHQIVLDLEVEDVRLRCHRGHHRHSALIPTTRDLAKDLVTGEAGHVSIEENDVDCAIEQFEGFFARTRRLHGVVISQVMCVQRREVGLVFDDENRWFDRRRWSAPMGTASVSPRIGRATTSPIDWLLFICSTCFSAPGCSPSLWSSSSGSPSRLLGLGHRRYRDHLSQGVLRDRAKP